MVTTVSYRVMIDTKENTRELASTIVIEASRDESSPTLIGKSLPESLRKDRGLTDKNVSARKITQGMTRVEFWESRLVLPCKSAVASTLRNTPEAERKEAPPVIAIPGRFGRPQGGRLI